MAAMPRAAHARWHHRRTSRAETVAVLSLRCRGLSHLSGHVSLRDRLRRRVRGAGAPQSGVWDELQISAEKQAAWIEEKDALAQKQMDQQIRMQEASTDQAEAVAGNVNTARIDE